jgi:hypothetical protein
MTNILYEGGFSWYIKDDINMITADITDHVNNEEADYLIKKLLHNGYSEELTNMQTSRFIYLRDIMKKKIDDILNIELNIDDNAEIIIMESSNMFKPLITMKISGKSIKNILSVFNKGIKNIVRSDGYNNELILNRKSMNNIVYSCVGHMDSIDDRLKFIRDYENGKGVKLWELRGDNCLYKRIEYDGKYIRIVC